MRRGHEPGWDHRPDVVPGPDLHHHLAVDLGDVGITFVHEDLECARRRDAVALPDRHQRRDLILETPGEEMVVELRIIETTDFSFLNEWS